MRARQVWAVVAAVAAAGMMIACGSGGADDAGSAPAVPATPTVDPSVAAAAIAEAEKAAGIPPYPDDETVAKYLAALKKINPEILDDRDPERIVDRGRDQCVTIKSFPDEPDKVLMFTNTRFSSPDHPNGFGDATAKKINKVIVKYICPKA
ncbi:hypothetical protein FB565_001658 [Actinoplanes lutulentus]|uniref:DUF732 domain-containing protein n=1 Tax=Actinoplanes lutulentus TaxID=1287878 RepID=A0A327ZFK6_9ACTN|nr:hypothetical protein [Actinoplanes lutulentus]MBB2941954.1 hypothetical protein [Actinoplanes lutulentus]RAK39866.1 hypothetical protein B0I29_104405 [Actinoplanes lutulentus]